MRGGIVLFPTETVYGIGASAKNFNACKKIYKIKNRPADNPFILHVSSIDAICEIAFLDSNTRKIMELYSPGPLTVILKKRDSKIFSSDLETVGLRIPRNKTALDFLSLAGVPIAAPSANFSGKPSITRFDDAVKDFGGKVDLILKGVEPEIGIESTVVDFTSNPPILLRHGEISQTELVKNIPNLRVLEKNENVIRSPGMKYRHYAPDCEVILKSDLRSPEKTFNSAQIGFELLCELDLNVKVNSNLEYMKRLYSFFIDCDENGIQTAYCEVPKDDEHKPALLDRIARASKK